jgi:hypothetical protein
MTERSSTPVFEQQRRAYRLPGVILLAGWALSGLLYAWMVRNNAAYDEGRFARVLSGVEGRIRSQPQGL